jgi:hypothetical protein
MKHSCLSQLVSFTFVIAAAIAVSCTDHTEPDPLTGCKLVDGTPRLYPCEFEILKVEFCNKLNVSDIFGTVMPGHPDISLPVSRAWSSFHPSPGFIDATFKVKIHVKRISNPAFDVSYQYVMPKIIRVLPVGSDAFDISSFPPVFPPLPVRLDMAVGDTSVVIADASYHAREQVLPPLNIPVYSEISGNVLFLIYNMVTAGALAGPPNNYPTILDVAESHIAINPTLVE